MTLRIFVTTPSWDMTCWSGQARPSVPSEDDWLIEPHGEELRLAVLDGVTFTAQTPATSPEDVGAGYAAGTVRAALRSSASAEICLTAANAMLNGTGLYDRPRDIPQATAIVADLSTARELKLVQAGDCSAWVDCGQGWLDPFDAPVQPAEFRKLSSEAYSAAPNDLGTHLALSRLLPDGPGWWLSAPIGRLKRPVLRSSRHLDVHRIVLATDGAMLSIGQLDDLEVSLTLVRQRQALASLPKGSDDFSVIHAVWRGEKPVHSTQ